MQYLGSLKKVKPSKLSDLLNLGDPTKNVDLESRNVSLMEDSDSANLKKLLQC